MDRPSWSSRYFGLRTISLAISTLILFPAAVESSIPIKLDGSNSKKDINFKLHSRRLDGDDENDDGNYDYYDVGNITQKAFDGYAFKFGKCQRIQRFSDESVNKGLYSSIVTDDIVVFRLCPERRCSASVEYGCTAGYGEYAMDLTDYLRTMMYYQQDKMQNLCMFCAACQYGNGNRREEESNMQQQTQNMYAENEGNNNDMGEDEDEDIEADDGSEEIEEEEEENVYQNSEDGDEEEENAYQTNSSSYFSTSDACSTYSNVCENYESSCDNGEYQDTDYMDYLEYFDCVKAEYQGVYYYVKPTCDTTYNTIVMGVFYDPSCSQYAGSDVTINKVTGMSFSKDIFTNSSTPECVACDYSEDPPFYNSDNYMCNKLFHASARCDTYFAYNLGDDDNYDDNDQSNKICTFIENIRYGSYAETGEVSAETSTMGGEVTTDQVLILGVLGILSVYLAFKACYTHHQITNFLLWQLTLKGSLLPGPGGVRKTYPRNHRDVRSEETMTSEGKGMSSEFSEFS